MKLRPISREPRLGLSATLQRLALLGLTWALGACASGDGGQTPMAWLGDWYAGAHRQEPVPRIDPQFAYLRAHVDGQPAAYLVLGYVDGEGRGSTQTWYSGQREALQLQQGRIVGAHGLRVGLRHVEWRPALPDWPGDAQPVRYQRVQDRDQQAYAQTDEIVLRASAWPEVPEAVRAGLKPSDETPTPGPQWRWFVERATPASFDSPSRRTSETWLAANARGDWVFTRQCLQPDYCLNLQVWP